MGGKLRCTAEMRAAAWSSRYWSQHQGNRLPWGASSCLIMKGVEKWTMHFCTCQCQLKIETVKYLGNSSCSAFCGPNSEAKVMLSKICARVLPHLCSKKLKSKNSHPHWSLSTKVQSTSEAYRLLVVAFVGNSLNKTPGHNGVYMIVLANAKWDGSYNSYAIHMHTCGFPAVLTYKSHRWM